jgi:predicted transcriptional regulator
MMPEHHRTLSSLKEVPMRKPGIYARRKAVKLTQRGLARLAGVPISVVVAIERETVTPTDAILAKLDRVLEEFESGRRSNAA